MIDSYGLIVQENSDAGDCPCRTGAVIGQQAATGILTSKIIASTQQYLLTSNGYIRYPKVYNDPKDFSRDQASRLMLGYGIAGFTGFIKSYYKKLLSNGLKHPNGDYLGISEVANNIRSLSLWWFYPLLLLLDVSFLVSTYVCANVNKWDGDNLMIMDLYWANKVYPTPVAKLARHYYLGTNPKKRVSDNLNSGSPGITCLEAYNANVWFLNNM